MPDPTPQPISKPVPTKFYTTMDIVGGILLIASIALMVFCYKKMLVAKKAAKIAEVSKALEGDNENRLSGRFDLANTVDQSVCDLRDGPKDGRASSEV